MIFIYSSYLSSVTFIKHVRVFRVQSSTISTSEHFLPMLNYACRRKAKIFDKTNLEDSPYSDSVPVNRITSEVDSVLPGMSVTEGRLVPEEELI